jgi:D-beta-D-heptose 7-phosphate kinase/D-beta-D-heptose 1-phosphate adenosyltransferase
MPIHDVLDQFPQRRVLVIGDIMFDEYIRGTVSRISPEAPVPIVEVEEEYFRLGGAANVVANIRALGGGCELVGVIGGDTIAERLIAQLDQIGVKSDGVLVDRTRLTTVKTRVVADGQHVIRFDRESTEELSPALIQQLQALIRDRLPEVDAIIISDYGKGMITAGLLQDILSRVRSLGTITVVDPKVNHWTLYREVTVLTPNHWEAAAAWGRRVKTEADILAAGQHLLDALRVQAVLITRGPKGMSLFETDGRITHIPAVAREVYDVTGAGDTVVGATALALASGATMVEAAQVANHAAGVVVGKVGTATVSLDELKESLFGDR